MALPRSFLALRDRLGPCEIVDGLARSFLALRDRFWSCCDRFWPCKGRFWPREIVYGLVSILREPI